MDQEVLVRGGQALVQAMDKAGLAPRLAMWVNTDAGSWKLWIVPPKGLLDKREFYRKVSEIVTKNREILSGIDASDTEIIKEDHPAARGLAKFIRIEGTSNVRFSGNVFDGFYLPDGIILRSAL